MGAVQQQGGGANPDFSGTNIIHFPLHDNVGARVLCFFWTTKGHGHECGTVILEMFPRKLISNLNEVKILSI